MEQKVTSFQSVPSLLHSKNENETRIMIGLTSAAQFLITLNPDTTNSQTSQFRTNVSQTGGKILNEYPTTKGFDVKMPPDSIKQLDFNGIESISIKDVFDDDNLD